MAAAEQSQMAAQGRSLELQLCSHALDADSVSKAGRPLATRERSHRRI